MQQGCQCVPRLRFLLDGDARHLVVGRDQLPERFTRVAVGLPTALGVECSRRDIPGHIPDAVDPPQGGHVRDDKPGHLDAVVLGLVPVGQGTASAAVVAEKIRERRALQEARAPEGLRELLMQQIHAHARSCPYSRGSWVAAVAQDSAMAPTALAWSSTAPPQSPYSDSVPYSLDSSGQSWYAVT